MLPQVALEMLLWVLNQAIAILQALIMLLRAILVDIPILQVQEIRISAWEAVIQMPLEKEM